LAALARRVFGEAGRHLQTTSEEAQRALAFDTLALDHLTRTVRTNLSAP
jgi:hypothetical protein